MTNGPDAAGDQRLRATALNRPAPVAPVHLRCLAAIGTTPEIDYAKKSMPDSLDFGYLPGSTEIFYVDGNGTLATALFIKLAED